MTVEGFETARNVLSYNPAPYMFHVRIVAYARPNPHPYPPRLPQQGNLRAFTVNNQTASLLSLWIDAVYDIVGRVNTLPVLTYKLDDLEGVYRARMQRDECGIDGKLAYINGIPHHIDVSSASTVCRPCMCLAG